MAYLVIVKKCSSKNLIEQFLLTNQESNCEKTTDKALSAPSGLDEHASKILEYIHSLPPAYNFEPHIVRQNRKNPFEHPTVTDVFREDHTIGCNTHSLQVRVYYPTSTQSSPSPALVYFHGGGFVLGDIASYDKVLAQLCSQSKVIIISIEYRLAPESVFPAAVEDTKAAMEWVYKSSEILRVDNSKIAIGGDSAGANLATVYCILNQDNDNFAPCFQLLIYPSIIGNDTSASRTQFSDKLLLTKNLLQWFHNLYISKELENDPRFNVLNFKNFKQVPPAFVITGGYDPLRDEGQMYVDMLRKNGVVVKHSCYTDMFHGFINYGALKQSKKAVNECANVLAGVMSQESENSYSNDKNSYKKQEKL